MIQSDFIPYKILDHINFYLLSSNVIAIILTLRFAASNLILILVRFHSILFFYSLSSKLVGSKVNMYIRSQTQYLREVNYVC